MCRARPPESTTRHAYMTFVSSRSPFRGGAYVMRDALDLTNCLCLRLSSQGNQCLIISCAARRRSSCADLLRVRQPSHQTHLIVAERVVQGAKRSEATMIEAN